jgi:hypothetical protein
VNDRERNADAIHCRAKLRQPVIDSSWRRQSNAARVASRPISTNVATILLTDPCGELAARSRTRRCEIEKMAYDALADRRERVSRELFEDVVQSMNGLFSERPRQRRIVLRRTFDTIDIEEKRGA